MPKRVLIEIQGATVTAIFADDDVSVCVLNYDISENAKKPGGFGDLKRLVPCEKAGAATVYIEGT